ncbi:hypothetical protein HK104_004066, partial [Borealophlyctis nickersoniae]
MSIAYAVAEKKRENTSPRKSSAPLRNGRRRATSAAQLAVDEAVARDIQEQWNAS